MLRRILLYVLVGVSVYLGYTRYYETVLASIQSRTAANDRANAQAIDESARDNKSEFEKALRRRETTEAIANDAERAVAERK